MFKFHCQQEVQVQVFNVIKVGTILRRALSEYKGGREVMYTVKIGIGYHDCVEVSEEDLVEQQTMPLGVLWE